MKNICNCYLLIAYIQNSQTSSTVIYSLMVPTSLMALDNIQFICQLWSLYRRYNYMNFFYCLHKTSLVLQRSLQISDPILEISLQISDPIPSHESGHIPEQRGLRWTPAPTMSCLKYRIFQNTGWQAHFFVHEEWKNLWQNPNIVESKYRKNVSLSAENKYWRIFTQA